MINKSWEPKGQSIQALKDAKELLSQYWNLHKEKPGRPIGWSEKDILDLYERTMKELSSKNVESDDWNEMDFLLNENTNTDVIGLKETLTALSDFSVNLPSILLCGSIVESGSTKGDIDIVICGKEHLIPSLSTIEMKKAILEMFPNTMWSRVKFKSYNGSAEEYPGKHVALYNPIFKRFFDESLRQGSQLKKKKQNTEIFCSEEEVTNDIFKVWKCK